ncbi:glycine cleavage system aminomethyltransferase GcvT [Tuberibacillus sp. Marseille-P3662]|uniref:glycine cleavage system aminomethyltransferase GcvT n=1 Tax=Tuberibacillus sp. Marseille-P3662 TaxID=1965358 RepID=UPI000A1CB859|nr:glycine cleavage system aminomethyltransferase GcvT [Tuberibacillus sp. Marseille-P3662]
MSDLKRTPLYEKFQENGAKTVDFGGWELPVKFSGIKDEHHAVRERAGLFDVSHMGEVSVTGDDAEAFLQYLVTNDIKQLAAGVAQYTAMCYEDGGTVDDLIIYKLDVNNYLLVINAANEAQDFEWIQSHAGGNVNIKNISNEVAQLAVQGPEAEAIVQSLTGVSLDDIGFFNFKNHVDLAGIQSLVSRTGYTGENGFEIYCAWDDAPRLWDAIQAAGESKGLALCGLGARDTLRFEAKLPLYGQELSKDISPVEAGIGFAVKVKNEDDFIGKAALKAQKENGAPRKLVGVEMIDKGIPRTHYAVFSDDQKIGEITTGTQSPTLNKNLGLALITRDYAEKGHEVEVDIRGKRKKAIIIGTPFYKRS